MTGKWLKKCLAAYAAAMLACGAAWGNDMTANADGATLTWDGTAATTSPAGAFTGVYDAMGDNAIATAGHSVTLVVNGATWMGVSSVTGGGDLTLKGTGNAACFYSFYNGLNVGSLTIDNATWGGGGTIAGKITINVGTYNAKDGGNNAAIDAADAGMTVDYLKSKLTIAGASKGKTYAVVQYFGESPTEDKGLTAVLENASSVYTYNVEFDSDQWVYYVTLGGAKQNDIAPAATADSSANAGLAAALTELYNGDRSTLDPATNAMLDALDALRVTEGDAAFGRAVTALNGANTAAADVQMGRSAVAQFNNALGSVFGDRHMGRVVAASAGGAPAGGRESASAGGVPVTFGETAAAADCAPLYTGWLKVYGGFGGQDATRALSGYSFGGVGVMTGLERKIGEELSLGALLGWSFNRSQLDRHLGDATDNILRLGFYGDFNWNNFFFNSTPSFGIHLLESERNLDFLGMTAKSDRTGFDFNFFNQVGYTYEFGNGLLLTPSYSLGMSYLHDPAHHEYGAPGANLRVADYDGWSLTQNLGVKVGKVFAVNDRLSLLPEVWAGWEHEYLESNDVSLGFASVAGSAWKAAVTDISKDRAVFGCGVRTLFGERWEANARYDQKIWDGGYSTNFALGISVKF